MNWRNIEDTPPEGVEVWTKIEDATGERMVQQLVRRGNLWFSDGMYVYYSPTHWHY